MMVPTRIPISFIHQKPSYSLWPKQLCKQAKAKAGKKKIFICSHVDSFTAEMGANTIHPVHEYTKCNNEPKTTAKVNPVNCQIPKFFRIAYFYPFLTVYVCFLKNMPSIPTTKRKTHSASIKFFEENNIQRVHGYP